VRSAGPYHVGEIFTIWSFCNHVSVSLENVSVTSSEKPRLLAVIGPGLLVAATGVGAGDLATASLTGIRLGTTVLWAVIVGAGMKYLLNEGLARWQPAPRSSKVR